MHWCIFSKLCRYVHHIMGGVLYSFWYWWNIVWIFKISCFLHVLCYFQHLKKIIGVQKILKNFGGGGGGGGVEKKTMYISFSFHFALCYFQHKIFFLGNIEKCPFTYWLNGRWFLQIVDIPRKGQKYTLLLDGGLIKGWGSKDSWLLIVCHN